MIASPLPALPALPAPTPVAAQTAAHNTTTPAETGDASGGSGFARLLDQALEDPAATQSPGSDAAADNTKTGTLARGQRATAQARTVQAPGAQPAMQVGQGGEASDKPLALSGVGDEQEPADQAPDSAAKTIDPAALLADLAAMLRPQPAPDLPVGKAGKATFQPGEVPEDPPRNGPAQPGPVQAAAGPAGDGSGAGNGAATPGGAATQSAAAALLSDPGAPADQTNAAVSSRSFAAELQAALPAAAAAAPAAVGNDHAAPGAEPPAVRSHLAASPDSPAFAPELGARLATFIRDGVHHARLELHPAQMGPLTVQIQLDGQAAQVHLAAQNADTRQALEQAMPQLAGSLREAGLTLSGGGVFEQPRQPQQDAPASGRNSGEREHDDPRASQPQQPAAPLRRRGVVDLVA